MVVPRSKRIEDYALIGDRATAALVGIDGSIDWLCLPRFDSSACFAALLGSEENGRWLLGPNQVDYRATRQYRGRTLILETEFHTSQGRVRVTDWMQRRGRKNDILRLVQGLEGSVPLRMELSVRFGYGDIVPWVSRLPDGRLRAIAGPEQLVLCTTAAHRGEDLKTVSEFLVREGEEIPFALTWNESCRPTPESPDLKASLKAVESEWENWCSRCNVQGQYADAVIRSLITLRALTHEETGGIVAAPTASLPEIIGGERNWDYRYCWLRDSTFTLVALMESGYHEEAGAWSNWLLRAVAGTPDKMQIMYGLAGERRLTEWELPHLAGFDGSKPVRIGNKASEQLQLDVFGEVLDSLYQARRAGLMATSDMWNLQLALVDRLEALWREPDEGLWEVRGGPRRFTWSRIMAWVAFDRVIRTIEEFGADGPIEKLRKVRDEIREDIETHGYDERLNSFVQSYGSKEIDASLLLIPMVGFLPVDDPRVAGTVAQVEKNLMREGFVERYKSGSNVDGLSGREGVFLACSFWLADHYILQGNDEKARALFERLLALRTDVGLLSEEYDTEGKRLVGNFPQAFSHVYLINTALNLTRTRKPAEHRGSAT